MITCKIFIKNDQWPIIRNDRSLEKQKKTRKKRQSAYLLMNIIVIQNLLKIKDEFAVSKYICKQYRDENFVKTC